MTPRIYISSRFSGRQNDRPTDRFFRRQPRDFVAPLCSTPSTCRLALLTPAAERGRGQGDGGGAAARGPPGGCGDAVLSGAVRVEVRLSLLRPAAMRIWAGAEQGAGGRLRARGSASAGRNGPRDVGAGGQRGGVIVSASGFHPVLTVFAFFITVFFRIDSHRRRVVHDAMLERTCCRRPGPYSSYYVCCAYV